MNLQEALNYAKSSNYFEEYPSTLEKLLDDNGISISIDYDLYKEHNKSKRLRELVLYEFSVDDHTGNFNIYTFDNKPFAYMKTVHEDSIDYTICDDSVFKLVVNFCLSIQEKQEHEYYIDRFLIDQDFPLIQIFCATYNVSGSNLLYIEDDGSFSLIEKYWQDKDEIKRTNGLAYNEMYYYKKFEIITNGIQRRVDYNRIVSVIGDNLDLAKDIANNKNLNDLEFEYVMKYTNISKLASKD